MSSRELASCSGSFSFQPACRRLLFRLYSVYYFLYRFCVQETSAHRIFLCYILALPYFWGGEELGYFCSGDVQVGFQAPFLYSLDIFAANFKLHLSHFCWGLRHPNLVTLCINNFVREFFSCCKTVKTKAGAFQTIDNYIKLLPC